MLQVFLIDDASSMKAHWQDVKSILELLAYIVKDADQDGMELYFTMGSEKRRGRHAKQLVEKLTQRRRQGRSNMRERLGSILGEYQSRLSSETPPRTFHGTRRRPPRRMVLYVLTDAVWQPICNVDPVIISMVNSLEQENMRNAQIGIQFVRLGNSREAKERLDRLDNGLYLPL